MCACDGNDDADDDDDGSSLSLLLPAVLRTLQYAQPAPRNEPEWPLASNIPLASSPVVAPFGCQDFGDSF